MAQFDLQITLEYDIITASDVSELIAKVNERIQDSDTWQPLGGAIAYKGVLCQTIVRKKKPQPVDKAICEMCGKEIIFDGQRWDHLGELKPRHPAWPKGAA